MRHLSLITPTDAAHRSGNNLDHVTREYGDIDIGKYISTTYLSRNRREREVGILTLIHFRV